MHKIISEIVNSYLVAQESDFELFSQRSVDAINECNDTLRDIKNGHMTIEPGGKYSYGRRGTREATEIVRAIAYDDIDSWRTKHLKGVIDTNLEVTKKGTSIQRIFILPDEKIADAKDVLDAHKNAGIDVYVASPDELPSTTLLESFMLVDDKTLVIFYYTRDGKRFRGEKISIDPIEVDKYIAKYNLIIRWAHKHQ